MAVKQIGQLFFCVCLVVLWCSGTSSGQTKDGAGPVAVVAEAAEPRGNSLLDPAADPAPSLDRVKQAETQGEDQDNQARPIQEMIESDQTEDGKLDLVLQFARDGYEQISARFATIPAHW